MSKPSAPADWATTATGGDITAPSSGKQLIGWVAGEAPPHNYFNWWQNLVGQWTDWLNVFESTAHTWSAKQTFGDAGVSTTGNSAATAACSTGTAFAATSSGGNSIALSGSAIGGSARAVSGIAGAGSTAGYFDASLGALGLKVLGGSNIDDMILGTLQVTSIVASSTIAASGTISGVAITASGLISGSSGLTISAGAVSIPAPTRTIITPGSGVTISSGAAAIQCWRDVNGHVHVAGDVLHSATSSFGVGNLPLGFYPNANQFLPIFVSDGSGAPGDLGLMTIDKTSGAIVASKLANASATNIVGATFHVSYNPTLTLA